MKNHWKHLFAGVLVLLFFTIHIPVFAGNPPDQGKSTITNSAAPADGLTSSTIKITLKDADGNTVSGNDSINITSSDSTTSFNPSSVTLDGSGTVTTQMKTTTVGNVQLKLTDVSANNTILTWNIPFYQPGTATPTPTSTPAPGACTDAAPGSTVQLTSAESSGARSITLVWTVAANPVSYYLLSYGISPGQYIYGNPNMGGQGTTSYTVGGLTTGKKYYFAVRAGNGCRPGTYSNELSAVVGDTPTPTPQPEADSPLDDTPVTPTVPPTDTPTPTSQPNVLVVDTSSPPAGSNSLVGYIMLGATALGVVCAIIGGVFCLRLKKR